MRVHARWLLIVVLVGGIAAIASPQPVAAQTRLVTQCSTNAVTAGSLTNILNQAQAGDVINFNIGADCTFSVTTTITITTDNLTIDATTTTFKVILDGGGTTMVIATARNNLNVLPALTLKGLTIQNGKSANVGGGILFNGNGNASGPTLTLDRSTIMNNSTKNAGGGLYNGGGIAHITNSTFTGNQVTGTGTPEGAAILNSTFGTMTIANATIWNNSVIPPLTSPGFGGGVANGNPNANTLRLTDTIVAGNQGGACGGNDLVETGGTGSFGSGGHNIIGQVQVGGPCGDDITGGIVDGQNGDRVGTPAAPINPLLGPLNDYGGTTKTLPLLPGSLALNAGAGCTTVDQRGVTRPQGAGCDIGAFESGGFTFSAPSGSGQSTIVNTAFANPLGVSIAAAQGGPPFNEPVVGGTVTFTITPAGGAGATFGTKVGCTVSPDMLTAVCALVGGIATSPALTANGTVGPYTATASATGVAALGNPMYQLSNVLGVAVAPPTLPGGTVGAAYSQTLTASGGSGTGYSFGATGTLPPGLTLSSAGLIAGTPTQAGPFTFTVTVTDSAARTGNQQYTVTIATATTTTAVTNATAFFAATAQNVPLTATVSASVPVNEGTVTFTVTQGATTIGIAVTSGTVANGQASATFSLPANTPAGAYTITAVYNPASTNPHFATSTNTGTLTVTTATVTRIVLTGPPAASQIKVGQTVQLTATATLSNGNTVDLTNQVQWTSANASIASVDARGKVTGQSPGGPVTITATLGAVTGQTQVTVVPLTPIGISVPPAPASRPNGATSGTPGQPAPAPAPVPSGSSSGVGVAPVPAPTGR